MKKIIVVVLALALVGGGVYFAIGRTASPEAQPVAAAEPVKAGNEIVAEAKVVPARSAALSLRVGGVVAEVLAQEGEHVRAGQTIARLDDAQQQARVAAAETKLQQAQASLDKLLAGATEEEVVASEAQLRAAQAQLSQAQTQFATLKGGPKDADARGAQAQLDQANTNLQAQRDALSASKTNAQIQLTQASDALVQAQTRYSTARWNWEHVQAHGTDPLNPKRPDESGKQVANKLNNAQKQQYQDAFTQAEAGLHSAEQAVQQAQVAYDTARQAEITGIAAAEQQVAAAQANRDRIHAPAGADQVAAANAQIASAKANLARMNGESRTGALDAAQAQVDAAQANLARLKNGTPETDLAVGRAQVASADAELKLARLELADMTIKAPFDGTLATLDLHASEYVAPGTVVARLADLSAWEIETSDLTELSVAKIREGAPATISFDALPGVELPGKVSRIKG
ncbi:MAG TPA: HlyD family efflux transporter periplasmic adaptor subunit, partial [Roseiflexaceae bacterium]|nr:HlyD family efflux transporter periplasmic adaptor subunit [Roseiflexaceae bacterium]